MKHASRWMLALALLFTACNGSESTSAEETAYLERTQGWVQAGHFPVARQLPGTDGWGLKFVAGPNWKQGGTLRVQGLDGKWMHFFAGDSGQAMNFYPQEYLSTFEPGAVRNLVVIASPEDSVKAILVESGGTQVALYQSGDSLDQHASEGITVHRDETVSGKLNDENHDTASQGPSLKVK